MRPTSRAATGRRFFCPIWSCSEWGLHEKYVTISPCELLPHNFNLTTALPVSAECFCCTFPIVTYAGRYPASLPCGARTFLIYREGIRDCQSYPKINDNDVNIYTTNIFLCKAVFSQGQCQVVVEFLVDRPKVLSDQLSDMPRSRPNFRSMFCVPLLPSKIGMPFSNMLKSRAPSHASFMIRSAYPP